MRALTLVVGICLPLVAAAAANEASSAFSTPVRDKDEVWAGLTHGIAETYRAFSVPVRDKNEVRAGLVRVIAETYRAFAVIEPNEADRLNYLPRLARLKALLGPSDDLTAAITEALAAARATPDDRLAGRASAFARVASAQFRAGDAVSAHVTLDEAAGIVAQIPGHYWDRPDALWVVADAQDELGDAQSARETLRTASAAAANLPDLVKEFRIVEVQAQRGDTEGARTRLEDARAHHDVTSGYNTTPGFVIAAAYGDAMLALARAQITAGDNAGAGATLVALLPIVRNRRIAEEQLSVLIQLLWRAGDAAGAQAALGDAFTYARGLGSADQRAIGLAWAADAQVWMEDPVGARTTVDEALVEARAARGAFDRCSAMYQIQGSLRLLKDDAAASSLLDEVIATARTVPDHGARASILAAAALTLYLNGRTAEGWQLMTEAVAAIQLVRLNRLSRVQGLMYMARGQAFMGDIDGGLTTVAAVPTPRERFYALLGMAGELSSKL